MIYYEEIFMTESNEKSIFITYIVATYNCVSKVDTLKKTISSLDGLPIEFIISDGGSSDGTLEEIKTLSNITVACSSPDEGIYDAWNKAIPNANGKYIGFIGVDDVPQREFIVGAIQKVKSSPSDITLLYGDVCLHRKNRYRKIKSPVFPKLLLSEFPYLDMSHQGLLHSKALFEEYNFDKRYKLAGDLHFLLRARKLNLISSYEKLNEIQAIVAEEGVSRSDTAWFILLREYKMIEEDLKVKIGYSRNKTIILSMFRYVPWLFSALKNISWYFRGKLIDTKSS